MNKLRFYKYLIIGLVIINAFLIAALIFGRPSHKYFDGPQDKVIEMLALDKTQVKQYQVLIDHHVAAVNAADEKMFVLREGIYNGFNHKNTTLVDSLKTKLSIEQALVEEIHLTHFGDLKGILNEDQLAAYNTLFKEIPKRFLRKRKLELKKKK